MSKNITAKLRSLLDELVETVKSTTDPFKVDVKKILDELSKLLPALRDEHLVLDSEILSHIVEVVRDQEEWVKNRSSMLVLGPFIALLKISSLSERELARDLALSWHPIVELEQITFTEIMRALNYLSTRKSFKPDFLERGELKTVGVGDLENLGILSELDLQEILDNIRQEVKRRLSGGGILEYFDFVKGESMLETFIRAYVISYLATMGELSIIHDPLKEEYYILEAPAVGEYQSIVIALRGDNYSS